MRTGPSAGEVRAANEIFTLLPEGHDLAVIIDALAGRNGVSDEARSELSARIRKLRIKGFRDANRAPHDRLVETILNAIAAGDHRLAAAILATWMQTHSALRERAAAHLRGRGIDVVDAPPVRFTSCWETDEWLLERNRMLQDNDDAHTHRDDAALMLSLVSGRFPGPPPVESELFKTWIDALWDLPASAPEWPADAANLGKWIRFILREKEREIIEGVVHKIAEQWDGIENEFNDDLRYLGIGPLTLQAPLGGPELLIGTLEFLIALRVQLEAYRPLRPQAASRQEELERSEARRAAEDGVLKLTAEWQERMARFDLGGAHRHAAAVHPQVHRRRGAGNGFCHSAFVVGDLTSQGFGTALDLLGLDAHRGQFPQQVAGRGEAEVRGRQPHYPQHARRQRRGVHTQGPVARTHPRTAGVAMVVGPFQRQRPEQRGEGLGAAAGVAPLSAAGARDGRIRMVRIVRVEVLRQRLRGKVEGATTQCLLEGLEVLRVTPPFEQRSNFSRKRGYERGAEIVLAASLAVASARR